MKRKIGVLVDNLGPSQLAYYLIKNGNEAVADGDMELIAFYENVARPCLVPNFACMQLHEAWGFDGHLLSTGLRTASKSLSFPCASARTLYVWDLEWLRPSGPKQYREYAALYGDKRLELISRSESHARLLSESWNRPVAHIFPSFEKELFLQ